MDVQERIPHRLILTNAAGPAVNISTTPISGPLACDGTLTASASGGVPPYQYTWNLASPVSGAVLGSLCAGTYCVRVVDDAGCVSVACETLVDPGCLLSVNPVVTDPLCRNATNGQIVLNASGSSGYSYSINGGATLVANPTFSGLSHGTYNWFVQDAFGCTQSGTVTLNNPPALNYSAIANPTDCNVNNGSIVITASGGTGALEYSINGGISFFSFNTFTGLGGAAYPVLVQDANGCQAGSAEVITVLGLPVITGVSTTPVSCFGGSDGTITITATTTTTPVGYSIDGGNSFQVDNPIFTGVSFGNYAIIVIEFNGCQTLTTAFVGSPSPIDIQVSVTEENCGQQNGSISISATQGFTPYQYSIDGGQSLVPTNVFNGIEAGVYVVVVEDNNGCQMQSSAIVQETQTPDITALTANHVSCFGLADGSVNVVAAGGVPPFEYAIDAGTTQPSGTFNSLLAGTYSVTVTDNVGCSTSQTVTVLEPAELIVEPEGIPAQCGLPIGAVFAAITGGTAPFDVAWGAPLNANGISVNGVAPGIYPVQVTDSRGCVAIGLVTVTGSPAFSVSHTVVHQQCPGMPTGSIVTEVSGGTAPFSYNWNNGATTASIDELESGSYVLNITDAAGCFVNLEVDVDLLDLGCLSIPTAISPNGDGANDVWIITGIEQYPDAVVEVYNKWGGQVFTTTGYQNDFDGTWNGEELPSAVYYFIVKISDSEVHTGSLTIIR
jgi:gliding motility-associated-like protein